MTDATWALFDDVLRRCEQRLDEVLSSATPHPITNPDDN